MASTIPDKNKFITETAQKVLQALLMTATLQNREPKALAADARKYAVALWRVMRHPIE